MKEETVLDQSPITKAHVCDLIHEHGIIKAIHHLRNMGYTDMNPVYLPDKVLRIMLWQLTHSLEKLEEDSNMTFDNLDTIEHFLHVTEVHTLRTTSNHLINAMDSLVAYVKS